MDLVDNAKDNYVAYSTYVIEDRAIPNNIDGLSPVVRRSLYAAYELGLEKRLDKAAKLVGHVLGNYHPHGDCLHGDTLINVDGILHTIRSLAQTPELELPVMSYDEEFGKRINSWAHSWKVGAVVTTAIRIDFKEGYIIATDNHPFYVQYIGWVKAIDITVGMPVLASKGIKKQVCIVENVEVLHYEEPQEFYDFSVDGLHNMYVPISDSMSILTHNTSCYGAIVNSTHLPCMLFEPEGNFGTMTDKPAAYRYPSLKLSSYSMKTFFNPYYLPVMEFVDNYDGSLKEPLHLVSLLPNLILNGSFGIAPGINAATPSFSYNSVIELLKTIVKNGKCLPKDCLVLEPISEYGGYVDVTSCKKQLLEFYKSGEGSMLFESRFKQKDTVLTVYGFAPLPYIKLLEKIEALDFVKSVADVSSLNESNFINSYAITLKDVSKKNIDTIKSLFSRNVRFNVQVTKRVKDGDNPVVTLHPSSIPQIVNDWLKYRIDLEIEAATYWIKVNQVKIDDLNLRILAVDNRDIIIKLLGEKTDTNTLTNKLAQVLKITTDKAKTILSLQLIKLRALEKTTLQQDVSSLEKANAALDKARTNPRKTILSKLAGF